LRSDLMDLLIVYATLTMSFRKLCPFAVARQ
jgi:hypothetical protein